MEVRNRKWSGNKVILLICTCTLYIKKESGRGFKTMGSLSYDCLLSLFTSVHAGEKATSGQLYACL